MPDVAYATCDGLKLAYQVVGDGPVDLLLLGEWATPLEHRWDVPKIAGPLRRLASFSRVITFDKRGIGLSDRSPLTDLATPEMWVRDTQAVLDEIGVDRVVVVGAHEGGPVGILFAASVPKRVEGLVLVNTGARLTAAPDYPHGFAPEEWTPDLQGMVEVWSSADGGDVHISATRDDPWWREWYARSRRQQASPSAGLALMRMLGELDVRHVLASIRTPTIVIHRRDNAWWSVEHARYLAERIGGATLIELPGSDNYWWSGDADAVVDEIERLVRGERTSRASDRELATLLFTDIVDSTQLASTVGDHRWHTILDEHDSVTAAEIGRHGGTVVKRLGDGLLATFDGPARALRAAVEMREAIRRVGVELRFAVHTGEIERRVDDITGIAVHLTARLLQLAQPGQVVVTGVVKGLVAGSGLEFHSLGTHKLRGIPDSWEVFSLAAET